MKIKRWFLFELQGVLNLFQPTYVATVCSHETKQKGVVRAFGRSELMTLPVDAFEDIEYCLDCVSEMAIRCPWCGKILFPGSSVTICLPDEGMKISREAVRYDRDKRFLVRCWSFQCIDLDAYRRGHWMPPGQIEWDWGSSLSPIDDGDSALVSNPSQQR